MKRSAIFIFCMIFMPLLVLACGCGGSCDGNTQEGADGGMDRVDYERGFEDGHADGYAKGYSDGREKTYNPLAQGETDGDDGYAAGYKEGWAAGYDKGYGDAAAEAAGAEAEMAEVEAAMLTFVKQNAVPGMEFRIENIVIHGDMAAGIAVCTSEVLETPLVVMERGPSGWYGVDFGTGIEPPFWYSY